MELVTNANYYATFGCTIQFGYCQRSDLCSFGELFGLFKGILAGRAIEHQKHLMGSIGPLPTHKRIFTVNRSTFVNKKSREQFQLSSFKRLIDIYSSTAKTVDALMKLEDLRRN